MWVETASEKKFWVGNPVVIVNELDSLLIAGELPCIVAVTHTGVGTVPAVTAVVTYPLVSDVACVADSCIPFVTLVGVRLKSTITFPTPLLLLSIT